MNNFFDWLKNNAKETLFFLLTWIIGWYLFRLIISYIDPTITATITTSHWTIFYTSLFLLLLPFVSKISLGSILKIERELKQTKKELNQHKDYTQTQIQFLTTNLNFISQNLSNNINIYNTAPNAETLESVNKTLNTLDPNNKGKEVEKDLDLQSSEDEWVWIFNLLKIRVQLEKELRVILDKRTSVAKNKNLDIKYLSLSKLFDMYIEKYPNSHILKEPLRLFNNVANSAIHGQIISKNQYEEAKELGIKILRNIRITSILE